MTSEIERFIYISIGMCLGYLLAQRLIQDEKQQELKILPNRKQGA